MKKIYIYALLCIPLCMILGLGTALSIGAGGQTVSQGPQYSRETDVTSMVEVGKLLEQLGKQMQQKSVSIGGNSYAVADKGSLEINVSQRGLNVEIGYGPPNAARKPTTLVGYARSGRTGTPENLVGMLDVIGKSLVSSGEFVMEDHGVALKGTASIKIRLMKNARPNPGRPPYSVTFDVVFGDKEFPLPDDEVDRVEEEKRGDIIEVAKTEAKNLDKAQLAEMFNAFSRDLKAGKVSVEDQTLEVGENFGFSLSHLTVPDGSSDRIRAALMFGKVSPREKPTGPRWGGEFFDASVKELAELLQGVFAGIAKDGTFSIEENDFKADEFAKYEIGISNRGINLELSYTQPVKK